MSDPGRCDECGQHLPSVEEKAVAWLASVLIKQDWSNYSAYTYAKAAIPALQQRYDLVPKSDPAADK